MAAEFSTLVSSLLDSKPEIYVSFFLDCVNSKQYLNTEKIPDGWIGKVNTFLSSKTDSWLGLCLLGITIEQCDTDTFTKNCVSWLRTLLQLIQSSFRSDVINYCSKLIDDILQYAVEFSELSREVSKSIIPAIISPILSNKSPDKPPLLSILVSCLSFFPGPTGPFKNQIQAFLFLQLNSPCEETRKSACRCFALLPRCNRSVTGGNNPVCPWEVQWNKVINTIHKLLDTAYENAEPDASRPSGKSSSQPETLSLGEIPCTEPGRTYTLVSRINSLLNCLSAMIREDFNREVSVPVDTSISLFTRILSVTGHSLKNAIIVESVLLHASLPLIHKNAVDFLTSLIDRCGTLFMPYCDLLMNYLLQELSWTKCQDPNYGYDKPYRQLRCSVYQWLEHWVQLTNSLPDGNGVVSKWIQQIMDDIVPLTSQTKLLPSTHSGNTHMSKKAKKRKLQEDVQQSLAGQQKFHASANDMLTYRALRALSTMLIACGSSISPEAFREIQAHVIKLIIQCQQSIDNSYPIPYGHADCRQALYHVLLCCLLTNTPDVSSPVNHAVRLFSHGCQDGDVKVSSFCQEALAVTNSIIHPRSFPQLCTPSGPLLLGASEEHFTNGPISRTYQQSEPESQPLSSLGQLTNQTILQSISSSGVFRNENIDGSSLLGVNALASRENQQILEDSNFVDTTNEDIEKSQPNTLDGPLKSSCDKEKGSNETDCNTGTNIVIPKSVSQLTPLSLNTSTARVLNTQGFLTDTNKGHTNGGNVNRRTLEDDICPNNPEKLCDSTNFLGTSQPKRRRVEDNNSKSNDQVCNDHSVPDQSNHHPCEGTEDNSQTIENGDSDQTSEMLASFVDSYPDSDDQGKS
ncbi:proline-, glutamic acid- and leucine-rich protein 1-like [Montipora foliosa]|uniref:proline-, glutamic acid- and leucine-rich protein 1-like n=1 Tax=Montipora foliosa TaxID=591990 RepID=UPI0035F1A979